jgi:hypothetical protein
MSNSTNRFDVRVQERLMKKGVLTEKELKDHIQNLPDVIEKGVKIGSGDELDAEEFTIDSK